MKKRVLLFGFLLVFLATASYALTFEATIRPVDSAIFLNETAVYTMTLRNDLETIENFVIYATDVTWSLDADPAKDRNPKVYPATQAFINLRLKPTSYITPGIYNVPITVKNIRTNELKSVIATVDIISTEAVTAKYLPGIRTEVSMQGKIDPREEIPIKVDTINQNPLNISELTIILRSRLISKEYTTTLGPLETKTVSFSVKLDPFTNPQQDVLYVTIKVGPYSFEPEPRVFNVISYGEIKVTKDVKKGFLKKTQSLLLENIGNERKKETVRLPYGIISGIFTETSSKPQKVMYDDRKHFAWQVELDPQQTLRIEITTNYQNLFVAILIILVALAAYYVLRSPMVISKTAIIIGRKHGGISDLSVRVNIVNRGKVSLSDVIITDKVPNLLDMYKEFEEGTLRPTSILKHEKKGTIVKWSIRALEPGEERIIHYKVKTRLSIIGSLSLPITVAKFRVEGRQRLRIIGSNRLVVKV